jgi:hypothetical protein
MSTRAVNEASITLVTSCPAFPTPLRVRAAGRAITTGCIAEDLVLDE